MTYILEPYDEALRQILKEGRRKPNRTGVDALSVCGIMSRYRIDEYFPLLTKRKIWPKSIFAELLWFLSGSTNNKDLQALGSNIWTPWVDPEFEKKHHYIEGSLGPVYGFQLRFFGGSYNYGHGGTGYGCKGFDQLSRMLDLLKNDPYRRSNVFSLWNPKHLDCMRLPPCHYTFQAYVEEDRLTGVLTQRSCDFPVGVPANIQFYSALTYMLAQQSDLKPYEFVHSTIDSHIYVDQIDAVNEYLDRPASDSPKLELNKAEDIDSYKLEDFKIIDYNPEPKIEIPVAV
jgi:thymidylate synthase